MDQLIDLILIGLGFFCHCFIICSVNMEFLLKCIENTRVITFNADVIIAPHNQA